MKRLSGHPGALPALVALLAFVIVANSPAHAAWQWLYPTPQGHTLHDVEFLTTTTAIAVGDASTIIVSHDAGISWTVQTLVNGLTASLNKVARIDDMTAIVVGSNGVLLKTTDGGATWSERVSGTTLNLIDVDFLGSSGMAVAPTLILRSTDGGNTWESRGPLYGEISGVAMLSPTTAIAVDPWFIWRTTDSGLTWSNTYVAPDSPRHISFHLGTYGVIACYGALLYVTSDGGATWQMRELGSPYSHTSRIVNDIEIVAPDDVAIAATFSACDVITPVCSSHGEAIASTDGGVTRAINDDPNMLHGVALSTDGVRLFVGDGGVIGRWAPPGGFVRIAGPDAEPTSAAAIAFADNTTGVAISTRFEYLTGNDYSLIMHTGDAGATWGRVRYEGALLTDAAFAPAGAPVPLLYSVGEEIDPGTASTHGLLIKSEDAGASWTTAWSDNAAARLNALAFASPERAVAVGEAGTVAVIDNGMVTTSNPVATSLNGIAFASATTGVAVGRHGVVLRTTDGGAGWSPIATGASQWLLDVAFADPSVGVAVGSGATVLRSVDAGATWSPVSVPTAVNLSAIAFTSPTHGFIAGQGGRALETHDAGLTWSTLDRPTTSTLVDLAPSGPHGAYFLGFGPIVLRYQQQPVPTLITSFEATASSFAVGMTWNVHDASDLDHFRIVREDADGRFRESDVPADRRSFRDEDMAAGTRYVYQLFAVERSGDEFASAPVTVTVPRADVALLPNSPNPFNPSTTLRFVVPVKEHVTLAVYDVAGRHVATLVDALRDPGMNTVAWNGTDAKGNPVASGVYISRLRVGTKSVSRTMVLLK